MGIKVKDIVPLIKESVVDVFCIDEKHYATGGISEEVIEHFKDFYVKEMRSIGNHIRLFVTKTPNTFEI